MTDSAIDALIDARNRITNRRDLEYNPDTSAIDAQLATVPAGTRNDVDLLLGRMCATLEQYATKPGWFQSPAVTLELSADAIAEMQSRCAETMTEAQSYDGMWM